VGFRPVTWHDQLWFHGIKQANFIKRLCIEEETAIHRYEVFCATFTPGSCSTAGATVRNERRARPRVENDLRPGRRSAGQPCTQPRARVPLGVDPFSPKARVVLELIKSVPVMSEGG